MSGLPRVCVFDLDGVLFRGETVIPDAPETLRRLRERGHRLYFLTNNSTQPRRAYVAKLTRLGMPCAEDEIVTSASATADYLARVRGAAGSTVFGVGGPGIADELERVGLKVVTREDPVEADVDARFVVVGLDKGFTYETLLRAQQCILRGAQFIATNRDTQYPTEDGVIPGGGSIVAAIAAASETEPVTVGKPEPLGLQTILSQAGAAPEEAVMIGDRPDTDILCGNRCGVPTVLVLTGVTTAQQARAVPADQRPTRTIATLRDL